MHYSSDLPYEQQQSVPAKKTSTRPTPQSKPKAPKLPRKPKR